MCMAGVHETAELLLQSGRTAMELCQASRHMGTVPLWAIAGRRACKPRQCCGVLEVVGGETISKHSNLQRCHRRISFKAACAVHRPRHTHNDVASCLVLPLIE